MAKAIGLPTQTFTAKLFVAGQFKVAGTLDGFMDLATPKGTCLLSIEEAHALIAAINNSIADIESNCLCERDALLEKGSK